MVPGKVLIDLMTLENEYHVAGLCKDYSYMRTVSDRKTCRWLYQTGRLVDGWYPSGRLVESWYLTGLPVNDWYQTGPLVDA